MTWKRKLYDRLATEAEPFPYAPREGSRIIYRSRTYDSIFLSRRYSARWRIAAESVPSSSYNLDRL